MSQNEQKLSCALCNAYLFEEDDVVYCPVCGAPHHRECYNSIGHCALEKDHGTENQYDLLKNKKAEKSEPKIDFTPNFSDNDTYTPGDEIFENLPPMDFLGGVPANHIIEDGITAKEARNFVISNTPRYIPKFTQLSKKHKNSWNFMAFFFPGAWLLSRKMYKTGIIVCLFTILATLTIIPFENSLLSLGFGDFKTYQEMSVVVADNISNVHWGAWALAFAGSILNLILRLLVAIRGDYWYRGHVIEKVKEIKETSDDIAEDFRRKGGVSLFMFLIGLLATQYLPSFIAIFL